MVASNLNVIAMVIALVIVVLAVIFTGVYCLNRVADRNAN
jgi:hypothetical protein